MTNGPTMPPPPGGDPRSTQPIAHAETPSPPNASRDAKPWWKKWWGIALIVLGVFVIIGIATEDDGVDDTSDGLTAAEEPDTDTGQEAEADAEGELDETSDPEDPAEEQEAIEEEAEEEAPEIEPEPEPEPFEPVVLSGSGDDIVDVDTYPMPMVATLEHDGGQNFAVWAFNEAGDRDLIVNTIGSYTGTRPLNFMGDPTEFEVTASGPWTITITPLLEQPALADTSSGSGDQVLFADASGRLTATHDGSQNFAMWAYGNTRNLLINEIGSYEGTVRLPDAVALEIVADGTWTLDIN
jgi:hypothetical protein